MSLPMCRLLGWRSGPTTVLGPQDHSRHPASDGRSDRFNGAADACSALQGRDRPSISRIWLKHTASASAAVDPHFSLPPNTPPLDSPIDPQQKSPVSRSRQQAGITMQAASANTPLPPKPTKRAHVNSRSTSSKQRNNLPIGTPSRTFLGNPHLAPAPTAAKPDSSICC